MSLLIFSKQTQRGKVVRAIDTKAINDIVVIVRDKETEIEFYHDEEFLGDYRIDSALTDEQIKELLTYVDAIKRVKAGLFWFDTFVNSMLKGGEHESE